MKIFCLTLFLTLGIASCNRFAEPYANEGWFLLTVLFFLASCIMFKAITGDTPRD